MLREGDPLPDAVRDLSVTARDGARVAVRSLFAEGPALVVLLRQFGCVGCSEQVHGLLPRLAELSALAVRVVLVASSPHEHIQAFIDERGLAGHAVEVVADPALDLYRALDLPRSFWATHGPSALVGFLRAVTHGHTPGRQDGDAFQQGGAVLLDDRGVVRWIHRSHSIADHADPSDVIEAALVLRSEAAVNVP